jgi:hypothetical protein
VSLGIVFGYPNKVGFAWWQWWAVGFRNLGFTIFHNSLHILLSLLGEESFVL